MTDISIIKTEGKGLQKLIETVKYWTSPWVDSKHKKKMTDATCNDIISLANAQAYGTKVLGDAKIEYEIKLSKERAKADREILFENELANYNLLQRAQQRILHNQIDNQKNIDDVIFKSQKYISDNVNDETVDPNWTKRFFDKAKDISDEEIQELWAQILVGEIETPKSFSFRTLDSLYKLTKSEAKTFEKLAQLETDGMVLGWEKVFFEKELNITFDDYLLLTEIGLLKPTYDLVHTKENLKNNDDIEYYFGDKMMIVTLINIIGPYQIPCLPFSIPGNELSKIIKKSYPENYIKHVANMIRKTIRECQIRLYDLVNKTGDMVVYDDDKFVQL